MEWTATCRHTVGTHSGLQHRRESRVLKWHQDAVSRSSFTSYSRLRGNNLFHQLDIALFYRVLNRHWQLMLRVLTNLTDPRRGCPRWNCPTHCQMPLTPPSYTKKSSSTRSCAVGMVDLSGHHGGGGGLMRAVHRRCVQEPVDRRGLTRTPRAAHLAHARRRLKHPPPFATNGTEPAMSRRRRCRRWRCAG